MEKTLQNEYLKIVVVALIVGVVGFGAGMKWEQRKVTGLAANFAGARNYAGAQNVRTGAGQTRTGSARAGFRPVSGEIISQDDKSITVKLTDGSSKIVLLGDSTTINKADAATKAELTMGRQVAVIGSENTDGSVTASSIQLDPATMGMMRGASPSASTAPKAY